MNPTSLSMVPAQNPPAILAPEDVPKVDDLVTEDDGPLPVLNPEDIPNVEDLVTEDDTPVDNIFSAKQQRLLVEPLYSSWRGPGEGRQFLADANVGLFYVVSRPPLVPDVFLSLDVQVAEDWWTKSNRSYFFWVFGKAPDVAIEIVSNRKGKEASDKFRDYAWMGIPYYVIYDPMECLQRGILRAFALRERVYEEIAPAWLPGVELGLTLWSGTYEGKETVWLRWCDRDQKVIPTGAERAEQESLRAAEEHHRAEEERQRAERLADQLRALGIEPKV